MTNNTNYVDRFYLNCLLLNQQSIPRKYSTKDYFGSCARSTEDNSANFLQNFVDDNISIDPQHYELLGSILFVMQRSKYRPIKKLLPLAYKKYNQLLEIEKSARRISRIETKRKNGLETFEILNNKKKMHAMSSADMCALGEYIDNKTGISTRKIKDKFNGFISYRIEMVLSGNRAMDAGFADLVQKYATPQQRDWYQRVAQRANMLILDEPTNHLDPDTQRIIGDNFRDFPGTIIAVSHNPDFVEQIGITRMLTLPDGRIRDYDHDLLEYYYNINSSTTRLL